MVVKPMTGAVGGAVSIMKGPRCTGGELFPAQSRALRWNQWSTPSSRGGLVVWVASWSTSSSGTVSSERSKSTEYQGSAQLSVAGPQVTWTVLSFDQVDGGGSAAGFAGTLGGSLSDVKLQQGVHALTRPHSWCVRTRQW